MKDIAQRLISEFSTAMLVKQGWLQITYNATENKMVFTWIRRDVGTYSKEQYLEDVKALAKAMMEKASKWNGGVEYMESCCEFVGFAAASKGSSGKKTTAATLAA